ncbi:ABC transporter permease subunit [Alphaproteobacteria bacterium LSUCC0684]
MIADRKLLLAMAATMLAALAILLPETLPLLSLAPVPGAETLADAINRGISLFVDVFKPGLRFVAGLVDASVRGLQSWLHAVPWLALVVACGVLGLRLKSPTLGAFSALAVLYMALSGHWFKSMNTLAMVGVSVPLALIFGFGLGVLGAKSRRANLVLQPALDLMQTIPTFAYLAPLVVLFGFGPVPGVLASMIYAAPPITRNVMLGLRQVPLELREVADISGASAWQRFHSIELPHAKQQILVGVNQTVLATLSMVIIAAVIGGFDDIGREVLVATNKGSARFGEALGAGIVIVLLAVVIDRLTRAAAEPSAPGHRRQLTLGDLALVIGAGALGVVFAENLDTLAVNTAMSLREAEAGINSSLNGFIREYGMALDRIKNTALVYVLLPMRIGLTQAILPFTWGVDFTPMMKFLYLGCVGLLSLYLFTRQRIASAVLIAATGLVLYRGFTFLPWWVVVPTVAWLSWRFAGWKFAISSVLMMLFITWAGHWQDALYSVYLCSAAVLVCLVVGCLLGVWAAKSDTVSRIMQPINDTLQSIPLYIFLIPAVALFQINEFSALVAIVLYAIVPLIRYTEHGLRNVPATLIEAATAQGCSRLQKLLFIELPVARPSILLGLNQTVLFALAMLIIAVLVGARGLAEQVNIGLRDANTGLGMTAGLSMAFIAIIADRILRGWAVELGAKSDL